MASITPHAALLAVQVTTQFEKIFITEENANQNISFLQILKEATQEKFFIL
jgi:hypothetical protein